ncbi:MAG: YihY/virulence factor BrkB family protein [Chitinophagaceae bacterium]
MRRKAWKIVVFTKQVFLEFWEAGGLKFSAALSYYTVFALAPVLVMIISICGLLFGGKRDSIQDGIFAQVSQLAGADAAAQVELLIRNVHHSGSGLFATILSSILLLIAATGIFGEIQDSINKIWGLKSKPKKAILKILLNRVLSFSVIISVGFVLVISLLINALVALLSTYLQKEIPGSAAVFVLIMDQVLTFTITTFIFALIFKILPDAQIGWKDVITGAVLTSILFMLGKLGIGYYVGRSNLGNVYGAAASIIILMVWVYYSSIILYLGAAFTKVYARHYGGKILPNRYAVWVAVHEVELKKMVIATDPPEAEIILTPDKN